MAATESLFSDDQLATARTELIFGYDTQRFPFHEQFRRMFQLEDAELRLDELHQMPMNEDRAPLSLALIHGFRVAGHKCPAKWNKALARKKDRLKKFVSSKAFKDFHDTFLSFVEEVIVPLVGDKCGLVFQDPPTFRVQLPSSTPIGKVHKDSDYESHVDTEINIWVPVTNVWGANTLHTESSPNLGDFHPLEARYGQAVRFWGNQCQHYTVANTTRHTRVSFDFRVIPRSRYTNAFKGYIGDYPTATAAGQREVESEAILECARHVFCLCCASSTVPASTSTSLLEAARLGSVTALGACFFFGIAPHPVDKLSAKLLWQMEASRGHAAALAALALCEWSHRGQEGCCSSRDAFRYWRRAARKGEAAACCSLISLILGNGGAAVVSSSDGAEHARGTRDGGEARDAREGISKEMVEEWLEKACSGGHARCLNQAQARLILESVEKQMAAGRGGMVESGGVGSVGRVCWIGWRAQGGVDWEWESSTQL